MRLEERPRRIAMLGGGYVSAELAHFFDAIGSEVSIIEQEPLLLPGEDEEISERFTEVYERRFGLHLSSTVTQVRSNGHELLLRLSSDGNEQTLSTDVLMLAVGRVPNSDVLQVERAGVEVDDGGFVKTNEYLETNVPGIWALGDIVGRYMLKHNANLEAVHVAHNIFSPEKRARINYRGMPHAVFASPQVAGVGVTERQAQRQKLDYVAGAYDYHDTAYGSSIEDHDGFVKVLADRETRDILGCHIIGTEASVLIQEVANAMRARLPTSAITQSVYVHPALPEVVQRAFLSVRFQ
jgi:dihydrolipoamide dehydrogenase